MPLEHAKLILEHTKTKSTDGRDLWTRISKGTAETRVELTETIFSDLAKTMGEYTGASGAVYQYFEV